MYPRARLPGIYVENLAAPPVEALPRMDIAIFVGFAASGPCHRAIAVENVAAFEAVFGGDLSLAFDPVRGEKIQANLAATVRAFFSNGGRQCWVIRVAMTQELAAASAEPVPPAEIASANTIEVSGMLSVLPSRDGSGCTISPARLAAGSLGAWSDDLTLSARISRDTIMLQELSRIDRASFSFENQNGLLPGDLLELVAPASALTSFAKVIRTDASRAWVLVIATFNALEKPSARKRGQAHVAGLEENVSCTLGPSSDDAKIWSLIFDTPPPEGEFIPGRWVRFTRGGQRCWLRIDHARHADVRGPAWREARPRIPVGDFSVRRVLLDVSARINDQEQIVTNFGLSIGHAQAIQSVEDDDHHFADADNRIAGQRPRFAVTQFEAERTAQFAVSPNSLSAFGSKLFRKEDHPRISAAWLPLGLGNAFGTAIRPGAQARSPLARSGLLVNDARLFIDPRFANMSLRSLGVQSDELRNLSETQFFGIHASIDIPSDLYSPASLIAAPDACLPDWFENKAIPKPLPPEPGLPDLSRWISHIGACIPVGQKRPINLNHAAFLDCDTEKLEPPRFTNRPIVSSDGVYTLRWSVSASEAASTCILEESAHHDFTAVVEVFRGTESTSYQATGRSDGIYYYRLRVERNGNTSPFATSTAVVKAGLSFVTSGQHNTDRLRQIHLALLRLGAATGDVFALLSLPRGFQAQGAVEYAHLLTQIAPGTGGPISLGQDEGRALSFGALFHPWLAISKGTAISATTPDGVVAGSFATRAMTRGAWVAPANHDLIDIIGLEPVLHAEDLLNLDSARINVVRALPQGFRIMGANTLSCEDDWRAIQTRRLMMLIRRIALRTGMRFVFEPNGPIAWRALDRSFTEMLDDLQRRGAFSGKRSEQSYRISRSGDTRDQDNGRMVIDIAVAPAAAMRFLTLRFAQFGSRFTIGESA